MPRPAEVPYDFRADPETATLKELATVSEALRFPRGVRLARKDEIPGCTDEILERIANARIATGFVSLPCEAMGYSTYIEANIHADEVWRVFEALTGRLLPTSAAPVVGWIDEDATLGPYTGKSAALSLLRAHQESLQHDGFIEFGLMFQANGRTEEVFVKACKYFQIWTNLPEVAEATLESMQIPKVANLQFIDEFPRVTERILGVPHSDETISAIVNSFQTLPPAPLEIDRVGPDRPS
jgi:hypothetical protein